MITVKFYYRNGQSECDEVDKTLVSLAGRINFILVKIDVDSEVSLSSTYGTQVPVIQIGPYVLRNPIGSIDLEIALKSAIDRETHLIKADDQTFKTRLKRGHSFSKLDAVVLWLSRHYMAFFNSLMGIFVAFSFLAPVMMKLGWEGPARIIYTVYSPFCHQLSFRSWFLFGEQIFYPRELAGVNGVRSFEEVFKITNPSDEKSDEFIFGSRHYQGDEVIGFKTALCQRDIAIYSSFLLFGLIFAINKRRNKPVRWILWLFLGVLPMAVDGISQFPGLLAGLPDWLPARESSPLLRTLTGGLFGFFSAWYLFPFMEESMADTRAILTTKKAVAIQSGFSEI